MGTIKTRRMNAWARREVSNIDYEKQKLKDLLNKESLVFQFTMRRAKSFARRFYEMWGDTTMSPFVDDFDEKWEKEVVKGDGL